MDNSNFRQIITLEGILQNNDWIDPIKDIDSDLFPQSWYREIFKTMKKLNAKGESIDFYTLGKNLHDTISFSELLDYLALNIKVGFSTFQSCVNSLIDDYMNIYITRINNFEIDANEKIKKINEFKEKYSYKKHNIEYLNGIMEEREELEKQGYFDRYLKTGFYKLDSKLEIMKEDLVVIGARPGVGKTTFGLQVISNLSKQNIGHRFIFFNLEMGKYQVEKRLNKLGTAQDLMLYNGSSIRISELRNIIESNIPKAICIDQLNKIRADVQQKTIRENFVIVMNKLKEICKDYGIVIFLLAQLGRGANGNDRPRLSDFKESGSVEEEVDIALLLERTGDDLTIHCDKYRNGATFKHDMKFIGNLIQFKEH